MARPPRKAPKLDPSQAEATRLIRSGHADPGTPLDRTVGPPIQRASTVLLPNAASLYDGSRQTYGRYGLAVHEALVEGLCELEGASHVQLYSSGAAAVSGALLSVLQPGDEVIAVDCVYAPTRRFLDDFMRRYGVSTRYVGSRAGADEIMAVATPATRLIVLESPGSLTFEMQDVPAIARAASEGGILTLIDNTWAAGLTFKPLAHGVDLSVQALTKYVCGHSDVFLGSAATNRADLAGKLSRTVRDTGWAVAPDDAYQGLRGLRTLAARMAAQGAGGLEVARWLEGRPEVVRMLHPALPGFPDHELWARDFTGACGLFAFVLQPAPEAAVHALLNALDLFGLGFSWGGFESLAIHCDPQLGAGRTAEPWTAEGPVVRLHVGQEDPADLIADLARGLAAFSTAKQG